jgi:hypothetical protein
MMTIEMGILAEYSSKEFAQLNAVMFHQHILAPKNLEGTRKSLESLLYSWEYLLKNIPTGERWKDPAILNRIVTKRLLEFHTALGIDYPFGSMLLELIKTSSQSLRLCETLATSSLLAY